MATMKENKGKEVVGEVTRLGAQSQPRPAIGYKRKNLSKAIDLENLPSRHKEKRAKHKSFKLGVVKPSLPVIPTSQQPSVHIHDVDTEPARDPPSKITTPASSQPSRGTPMNLLENEVCLGEV